MSSHLKKKLRISKNDYKTPYVVNNSYIYRNFQENCFHDRSLARNEGDSQKTCLQDEKRLKTGIHVKKQLQESFRDTGKRCEEGTELIL
jgi:hypothetical protein